MPHIWQAQIVDKSHIATHLCKQISTRRLGAHGVIGVWIFDRGRFDDVGLEETGDLQLPVVSVLVARGRGDKPVFNC